MIHGLSKLKCSRQFIILVKTLARSEHNGIHIHDTHNNCQLSAECGGWKWHQHKIFERKNLFHSRYFFSWIILWWSHRLQRGILLEMLFMYNSFYLCWWIVLCATDEDLFAHTVFLPLFCVYYSLLASMSFQFAKIFMKYKCEIVTISPNIGEHLVIFST